MIWYLRLVALLSACCAVYYIIESKEANDVYLLCKSILYTVINFGFLIYAELLNNEKEK